MSWVTCPRCGGEPFKNNWRGCNHCQAMGKVFEPPPEKPKEIVAMTDEELFEELRIQVNLSRGTVDLHDRARTRELGRVMRDRGFRITPSE